MAPVVSTARFALFTVLISHANHAHSEVFSADQVAGAILARSAREGSAQSLGRAGLDERKALAAEPVAPVVSALLVLAGRHAQSTVDAAVGSGQVRDGVHDFRSLSAVAASQQ